MTKALDVPLALKAMFEAALTNGATVIGLDGGDAAPDRLAAGGRVTVEAGEPGTPTIDLCPPVYNYEHQIPVTVEAIATRYDTAAEVVSTILGILGAAIAADRFLGGLVDYLDAAAPASFDETSDGTTVVRVASAVVIATYSTTQPL